MLLRRKNHSFELITDFYGTILEWTRNPVFYTELAVKDEFESRFDLLVLHLSLVTDRLLNGAAEENEFGDNEYVSQTLFDVLFKDMEYALRESGVGDLGVPKHIKRMMKAYKGRYHSYVEALEGADKALIEKAVLCNLYADDQDVGADVLTQMAAYIEASKAHLAQVKVLDIVTGTQPCFADVTKFTAAHKE